MTMLDPVDRAQYLATLAHYDVVNKKNGEPYIDHPRRVVNYMRDALWALTDSKRVTALDDMDRNLLEHLRVLGWLHDTIEDTWVDSAIISQIFGAEVAADVWNLSIQSADSRQVYLEFIAERESLLVVKFSDLMDNGDPKRIAKIADPETRTRLTAKYEETARVLRVVDEFNAWCERRLRQMDGVEVIVP